MNDLTQTYSLNLNNLKFQHGDFTKSEDWTERIYENGGFSNEHQWMAFECEGIEVVVDFDLLVCGKVSHDPGDYWTPPYTDCDVTDIEITVTNLNVDQYEVELNPDLKKSLEIEIKKYL